MPDDEIQRYADAHTSPEPPLLARLNRETHVQTLMPRMLSGHAQGRLLSMVSYMVRPRRVLELGTFTGYAALCLAEGLTADGALHTIEQNPELEDRIRRYVAAAGLAGRVRQAAGELVTQMLQSGNSVGGFVQSDADLTRRVSGNLLGSTPDFATLLKGHAGTL